MFAIANDLETDATQLLLNDYLVTIRGDTPTIQRLNTDDAFLADYVNKAAKAGQFHFLFSKNPTTRRIVVKRLSPSNNLTSRPFFQIWKGKTSHQTDIKASLQLLKLRNCARFNSGPAPKSKLWEEIAQEMRDAGYDVDAKTCLQKHQQLLHTYQNTQEELPAELLTELKKESDEEWVPKQSRSGVKRKRNKVEDEDDMLMRQLVDLMRRKNQLLEEKLKQNRQVLEMLAKLTGLPHP